MKQNIFSLVFLGTIFLGIISTYGQHSSQYSEIKEEYPDARIVRLKEEVEIRISLVEDSIVISKDYFEEKIYLDETANYGSKESIHYSSFFEIENLEASSFSYENGKYKELKVEEFKEKDELNKFFYDDNRTINFIYPNLKKGSKTRLSYTENIKNPRFLGSFYFGDFSPILFNQVTLIVDEEIEIEFIKFNTSEINLQLEKKHKRGKNIYIWKAEKVDQYEYESKVPSYAVVLPHIIPKIVSYTSNGEKVELSKDVSNLYDWYYSLIKDVNTDTSDPELVKLVEQFISMYDTDLERVKAMYYWAQQNIKYIAFEYALGGFVPREANDVFKKKYGDCKDNSSILKEMLEIAGLKGQITWLGTRSIPYTYEEVPLPIVDNHMILSYTENGNTYFLDATGRYTPLGFPTSFIQGKEALIADGLGTYSLVKVPEVPAEKNKYTDISNLTIINNDLVGIANAEVTGYKKRNFFLDLEDVESPSQLKEYYNSELRKGNNKFLIDSISEKNKYEYDMNFEMDFSYTIQDYVKKLGDEVYVNLNLNKPIYYFKIDENRENDIDFDFKDSYSFKSVLQIPQGYAVDYLPESVLISNGLMDFEVSYIQEKDSITYEHKLSSHFLKLNIAQQQEVNDFIKKAEKVYNEVIVFKEIQK